MDANRQIHIMLLQRGKKALAGMHELDPKVFTKAVRDSRYKELLECRDNESLRKRVVQIELSLKWKKKSRSTPTIYPNG